MKKFCTKCGREFEAVGREVICPACKAAAAVETKRAAVMRAKRASWTGESVPVRISGRASTVIRQYGTVNNLSFAAALDALLQTSAFFKGMSVKWEDITPYKSHRRDKHATEVKQVTQDVPQDAQDVQDVPQEVKQDAQDVQDVPQDAPQEVKTAAKAASKASASKAKASASKASKAAGKAASKATSKASKTHTSWGGFGIAIH